MTLILPQMGGWYSAGGGVGWDLSTASYDGVSFSVSAEVSGASGMTANADASLILVAGRFSDAVFAYSLSTPSDLSTATYTGDTFSVLAQDTNPYKMVLSDAETELFILGGSTDTIYKYDLSIAGDISTATYSGVSLFVGGTDDLPYTFDFGDSGNKLFMAGARNDAVYQYDLSTPWDISTATYSGVSFSILAQITNVRSMALNPDGLRMVFSDSSFIYQYDLSTPWDISTATYNGVSLLTFGSDAVFFMDSGGKFFTLSAGSATVYQYSIG